mmetsp:Transcript_16341/g.46508  ORF Transcript_16341/g.46508 Transcript_16341/m.46508 type:complete len:477 (+) Transcript_16341:810-2240(+)
MSFLQSSHLAYSSFCCRWSSAYILSIASLTFVKASKRTRTASDTSAQFLFLRATLAMRATARSTARSWAAVEATELTCTKLMVLSYRSRASSVVRILMVSASATSSCERISERFLYSASSWSQSLRMFPRNSWSASSAAVVRSSSRRAAAASLSKLANEVSASSFCCVAAAISPSLAARRCWKFTSAMKSAFWASDRSAVNWSRISASKPKMPPERELKDFAPEAAPSSSLGLASWPTCSSVFSHGSSPCCWKEAAARRGRKPELRVTKLSREPKTSKRSFCIRPWNCGWPCWTLLRNCRSTACARERSSWLGDWPFCTSWTFSRTSIASRSSAFVSFMSASAAWKASNSFCRVAVAVAKASWSSAMSCSKPAIEVLSSPSLAAASSKKAVSSAMCAVASSMAWPFSFSLVWHQHMNLLYEARSWAASFSHWAFISSIRVITRRIGRMSAVTFEVALPAAAACRTKRATSAAITLV